MITNYRNTRIVIDKTFAGYTATLTYADNMKRVWGETEDEALQNARDFIDAHQPELVDEEKGIHIKLLQDWSDEWEYCVFMKKGLVSTTLVDHGFRDRDEALAAARKAIKAELALSA